MKRVHVAVKHLKPYLHLFKAANLALKRAKESEDNSFYDSMSCVLFCALSLEAYLNHVGSANIELWEGAYERMKPKEKLEIIRNQANSKKTILIDLSRRPFQSFRNAFSVRNDLAHGKTEYVSAEDFRPKPKAEDFKKPKSKWEKFCTVEEAEKLMVDTEKIIRFLHSEIYETTQDPFPNDLTYSGYITV